VTKFISAFRDSFALRAVAGFTLAALILTIGGLLAQAGTFQTADLSVRQYIQTLETPWLTSLMTIVTRLGSTEVLTALGAIVVAAFAYMRWRRAIFIFLLAMAGQILLHLGFKALFNIERPDALLDYVINDTNSFPSGHAVASTSFYGIVAAITTLRTRYRVYTIAIWTVAAVVVVLVCLSRLYFGVHHPSDVIAGSLAAAVWTAAVASGDS
jgi:undecaprenyl-diphosphatase